MNPRLERGSGLSAEDVDKYLQGIDEPKRTTLEALRRTILEVVPDAEQVISYKVPAFRVEGRIVAGFAAFKDHLSYLPFSGSVLPALASEFEGYTMTKSVVVTADLLAFVRANPAAIRSRLTTCPTCRFYLLATP